MKYFGNLRESNLDDKALKRIGVSQKKVNERYLQQAREKLAKYDLDINRESRLEKKECKNCFYIENTRIGGSAMTTVKCIRCRKILICSSTNTDHLCESCADELNICKRCFQALD